MGKRFGAKLDFYGVNRSSVCQTGSDASTGFYYDFHSFREGSSDIYNSNE